MKVVHLIGGLRGGGAEHLLLELGRRANAHKDISFEVVSLSRISDIAHLFTNANITVVLHRDPLRAIWYLIRQNPSLIHAHLFNSAVAASLIRLFRPATRVVFTLHNTYQPGAFRRFILWLTRPLRHTDIIFPHTKPAWYMRNDAVSIANGVDLKKFSDTLYQPPSTFTILFAGRLTKQKNPLWLINLANTLQQRHEKFLIRVAGDGPLLPLLKRGIADHHLHPFFEILGYRDDMPQLLASSSCLVLPSLWEGMPLILLEAAVVGTPVLSTSTGNSKEILAMAGVDTYPLEKIAESIAVKMEDPGPFQLKAALLKDYVKRHFSIDDVHQEHVEQYRKLLQADQRNLI